MKPLRPVTHYEGDRDYPARDAAPLSRRGFLGRLLQSTAVGGVAALGGLGALAEALAASEARGKGYRSVTFQLLRPHQFRGCHYSTESLHVQTRDAQLVAFLADGKERAATDAAIRAVLAAHGCGDLTDQKRLARLHAKLGETLAARFRQRRRRQTPAPFVTIALGTQRRYPLPPGVPRKPYP